MAIKLNPDKDVVASIKKKIKDNDGYCPCILERSEDTKCPCKDFKDTKECHCGLYVNEEV